MKKILDDAKKALDRICNRNGHSLPTPAPPVRRQQAVAAPGGGPARPSSAPAPPKKAPSAGATRMGAAPIREITSVDELPKHRGLVAFDREFVATQLKYRDHYILLETGPREFCAFAIEQYFMDHLFLTAVDLAERAGWRLVDKGKISATCLIQLNSMLEASAEAHQKKEVGRSKSEQSKALNLFREIVKNAVEKGASDIHICIRDPNGKDSGTGVVLFRIHGLLKRQGDSYPSAILHQLVTNTYTSTEITDEHSRDKDQPVYTERANLKAMMRVVVKSERISLRFQQIQVNNGIDAIWRILRAKSVAKLSTLGYESSQQYMIELASRSADGLVLLVGVTGSGKTTTLMSTLAMDPEENRTRKVFTVEDPPEYHMFNTSQAFIQRSDETEKDGKQSPFQKLMRDLMRADPDVIMLGEIRDTHSGQFAQAAVQSGHAVYATLHGKSAVEAVPRLASKTIGINRDILCMPGFIRMLVYQRLLRVLCPKCKQKALEALPETMIEQITRFGINPEKVFTRNKKGCEHCKGIGAVGRTVCAEVILPDRDFLKLFHSGNDWQAEEHWRSQRKAPFDQADMRGKTAFEHALYKMSCGMVDPVDIDREIHPFETYHIFPIAKTNEEGVLSDDHVASGEAGESRQPYKAAAVESPGPN